MVFRLYLKPYFYGYTDHGYTELKTSGVSSIISNDHMFDFYDRGKILENLLLSGLKPILSPIYSVV